MTSRKRKTSHDTNGGDSGKSNLSRERQKEKRERQGNKIEIREKEEIRDKE